MIDINRAERRRLEKQNKSVNKEPVINIKSSDIDKIKQNATKEAVDKAFLLMLAIPTIVIHDRYSSIMKKEVDGLSREERFIDMCLDLYKQVEDGSIDISELHKRLWDEAGIKIEKER